VIAALCTGVIALESIMSTVNGDYVRGSLIPNMLPFDGCMRRGEEGSVRGGHRDLCWPAHHTALCMLSWGDQTCCLVAQH